MFKTLEREYGKFTVDLFANQKNHKVDRFYSKWWHESSCGVNAFSFDWESEHALIVPPVAQIVRAFRKCSVTKMSGVLVIPVWDKGRFWPLITPDGCHGTESVQHMKLFYAKMRKVKGMKNNLMTDKRQAYLAILIHGKPENSFQPNFIRSSCIRVAFGQTCSQFK